MTPPSPVGPGRRARGFTLLELVLVLALMAAASYLLVAALGEGQAAALQAGQATVVHLVGSARSRAAHGRRVRILFHHDSASPLAAERYLRLMVMEEWRGDEWRTLQTVSLPPGIHVMPHQSRVPAGLLEDPAQWTRPDGTAVHSSALFRPLVHRQVDAPVGEAWAELAFTGHGTTASSGQIVLTPGLVREAGTDGQSRLVFAFPRQVRGVQVSAYGLAVPVAGRGDF
ncbi:MAG TPA: prepilin-type N-terminal cleavage/methylation domain-containing protein [Opitutaceae bacterium]|nr:prepilin-type N-terminal cleavage/methylation domain-containing protein [Opitutaceae bacterium]